MISTTDAHTIESLEFQAQQLRMLNERLSYVSALFPSASTQWRGPAQQLFDAAVHSLHRDLAQTRSVIDNAEQLTSLAASQLSSRVG